MSSPLGVYGDALRRHTARAPATGSVRFADGAVRPLDVPRWTAPADAVDEHALARLRGPVLDVGCGPGRHLHALARRGVFALGVDISPVAIALARDRGVAAMLGSVFGAVPHEGHWQSALLLDGNIGIGGDPARLLGRVGELLVPGGAVLVELEGPGCGGPPTRARIETPTETSDWFAWRLVGAGEIGMHARRAGLAVAETWSRRGRCFALLGTRGPTKVAGPCPIRRSP